MSRRKNPCKICNVEDCWKHCNNCFAEIMWRPRGWRKGTPYNGPKPLNLDGTPHDRCVYSGEQRYSKDPIIQSMNYSKTLSHFLHKGYGEWYLAHMESVAKNQGVCMIESCKCHEIDAMKDPVLLAKSEEERKKWI